MQTTPDQRKGTRIDSVMQSIRDQLASRVLMPGERLPSIRQMAARLNVSKNTIVDAYDRLAADGLISAKRGSGFYVCGHLPPLSLADIGPRLDRCIDPLWLIRQSLEAQEGVLKPGCGWLPPSWLPDDEIRRALRRLTRQPQTQLLEYGHPYGHFELREQLSRRLLSMPTEIRTRMTQSVN